jgi:hypothetical protein
LEWHRSERGGLYADATSENLRYYIDRTAKDNYIFFAYRTVEVSGIITTIPNEPAVDVDGNHESQKLAKAVAEAYDSEPLHSGPMNRMTRAINKGYSRK